MKERFRINNKKWVEADSYIMKKGKYCSETVRSDALCFDKGFLKALQDGLRSTAKKLDVTKAAELNGAVDMLKSLEVIAYPMQDSLIISK